MKIDLWALGIATALLLVAYLSFKWAAKFHKPKLFVSSLPDFEIPSKSMRERWRFLPSIFYALTLSAALLAFLNPHRFILKPQEQNENNDPREGRILFLVLDQSGSMNEKVQAAGVNITKIAFLRETMTSFVKDRPDDLLGLVAFARVPHILSPPTLDHQGILNQIAKLQVVSSPDQDGTAIGYAIFMTSSLIANLIDEVDKLGDKAPYQIKSSAIILVTDGLQDPNPLDKDNPYRFMSLPQATDYAKKRGVKLYVINISPELAEAKYLPNLRQLEQLTSMTGGHFYHLQNPLDLKEILKDINQLETSKLIEPLDPENYPSRYQRVSYYPYLLLFSLAALILAVSLQVLMRRDV